MSGRHGPSPLFRELLDARATNRKPELQACLTACRLTTKRVVWGAAFVTMSGLAYDPDPLEGKPAIIAPAYDTFGELIDLVAHRLCDKRIATRRGLASVLGEEWLEAVRRHRVDLLLHGDPMGWLVNEARGVVILDWSRVPSLLDGIECVVCASASLAKRVHDTTRRMHRPPRLQFIKEKP